MTKRVLVIDDSPLDRRLAAALLEEAGFETETAENGRLALNIVDREAPDLVLTDIQMPELDGFQLVRRLRQTHPALPVILMTAFGSEEVAVQALQEGAASYVPKGKLPAALAETVHNVLGVARNRQTGGPLSALTFCETQFELDASLREVNELIAFFQDYLRRLEICDDADLIRVGTALHEAIVNAAEHGNLELSSDLREQGDGEYRRLAKQRAAQQPYSDRRVQITARFRPQHATFEIKDEGPGFDADSLPDPTDPENLGKVSGRGLFLIKTFMDEVQFNELGNQITLTKHRKVAPA